MKRRSSFVIFLMFVFYGCMPHPKGTVFNLENKLPKYEKSFYEIFYKNKKIGKLKILLKEEDKKYIFSSEVKTFCKEIKTFVQMDKSNLTPISSIKNIKENKDNYEISSTYSKNLVKINLKKNNKKKNLYLEIPDSVYDNDSFLFLLRFISKNIPQKDANCLVVVPQTGQYVSLILKIKKEKDFYKVEILTEGDKEKKIAYYETKVPFKLIKYEDKNTIYKLGGYNGKNN